jgi:hypothetical protein
LKFIQERYQQSWAFDMEKLLLRSRKPLKKPKAADHLSAQQIADFEAHYDTVVLAGLQANLFSEPAALIPQKAWQAQTTSSQEPARSFPNP